MYSTLPSLIPNIADLLALEVEELAGVLLIQLRSYGTDSRDGIVSRGQISQHAYFNIRDQHPEYPSRKTEISQALMEAWSWLEREGLLVRDPLQSHSPWFFISRRA